MIQKKMLTLMTNNKRKNVALIVAAVFLFLALFDGWQYGFFTILRFVVFASTAYVAYFAYQEQKEGWTWFLGAIAVLFNPFFPIHLDRETWVVIDFVVGALLLVVSFFLKFKDKKL